jgi:hypothetical protein
MTRGRPEVPAEVRVARIRADVLRCGGRWPYTRKARLFDALNAGHITVHEILMCCGLSPSEVCEWWAAYKRGGIEALRITKRGGW